MTTTTLFVFLLCGSANLLHRVCSECRQNDGWPLELCATILAALRGPSTYTGVANYNRGSSPVMLIDTNEPNTAASSCDLFVRLRSLINSAPAEGLRRMWDVLLFSELRRYSARAIELKTKTKSLRCSPVLVLSPLLGVRVASVKYDDATPTET